MLLLLISDDLQYKQKLAFANKNSSLIETMKSFVSVEIDALKISFSV